MDKRLERLGEAIAEIWLGKVGRPLVQIEYVNSGGPLGAAVSGYQGGYRVVVQKHADLGEMLRRAFHEMAHAFIGLGEGSLSGLDWETLKDAGRGEPKAAALVRARKDDPAEEQRCDRLAEAWLRVWRDPVLAFVECGDPGPVNEILAAERWVRKQARRKAEAGDAARRFAEIAKAHGVVELEQAPNHCSPSIKFAPLAVKALDAEIEDWIRERGITDPAMVKFVGSVLTRRKRFINFVSDLIKAGLVASPA